MNTYLIKYIAFGNTNEQKEFQADTLEIALSKFKSNYQHKEILSIEKLKI